TTSPVFLDPSASIELGAEGSADLVLTFREMHNWHRNKILDTYVAAVFKVLKPGGTFGVVQHRAKADANPDESAQKGYLPEKWLIEAVEKAGFKLAEKSEVNANPKDTKDYEGGVWTLPPNLRGDESKRDEYVAIGESDRMTLKFVKPAK
ncbi:MAG: methyltransferase, partial [Myxococcota bacterium]